MASLGHKSDYVVRAPLSALFTVGYGAFGETEAGEDVLRVRRICRRLCPPGPTFPCLRTLDEGLAGGSSSERSLTGCLVAGAPMLSDTGGE